MQDLALEWLYPLLRIPAPRLSLSRALTAHLGVFCALGSSRVPPTIVDPPGCGYLEAHPWEVIRAGTRHIETPLT